jgi:hypothetical protein
MAAFERVGDTGFILAAVQQFGPLVAHTSRSLLKDELPEPAQQRKFTTHAHV